MYRDLMTHSTLLVLPILALFLFVGVFVAIFVRTYGRAAKDYDALANLPLAEDSTDE
jgi:cbb3-type cytochrome oxidase subunit 3